MVGTAEKVWSGIGAALVGLVGVGALTPSTGAAGPLALGSTEGPALSTVTVTDVIDGDTVRAGSQVIHVIGIDSCPVSTPGGIEAKEMAEAMLGGRRVTLRTEPGVDRDASGRLLRRIDLADGGDYGTFMVPFAHTAADASYGVSRQYLADLRDNDGNGRTCG
ncbi:thermonuclease family protein [Actinomycetospora chiangmaiensis]|uniref:thermonuclease family protein n=1 Tax=Actinomycetospora chiangmaiensis TaxID=402650 RepID=UPI00035C2A63|nr:thermonuclease family protein [Actinomycetospora chiangmaiensis]